MIFNTNLIFHSIRIIHILSKTLFTILFMLGMLPFYAEYIPRDLIENYY